MMGYTQSLEYAELEWPLDGRHRRALGDVPVNVFGTIIKRREEQMYVSLWYVLATSSPSPSSTSSTTGDPGRPHEELLGLRGTNSANVQWWYGHNAVGFVFTTPILAMFYYFLPKSTGLRSSATGSPSSPSGR